MYISMVHSRIRETDTDRRVARYRAWESDDLEDEEYDLSDAYTELIQQDPVVCDNCFLTKYDRVAREWWRGSFGWLDYERWVPKGSNVDSVPGDEPSDGTRLVCGNCGYVGMKERPVPKHEMEEYLDNLIETLHLKEIEFEPAVLRTYAHQHNTSDNQGRQDSHVFAPAVQTAIVAAKD